MIPIVDYHLHTFLCGHATGKPQDYANRAIEIGLEEIGFSDHAPFVTHRDPTITMGMEQLPEYHRIIEDMQKKFPKLRIKAGIEADFSPGYEDKTRAIVSGYRYDYVIGSVHHLKSWAFDSPSQRGKWDEKDVNAVYYDYYDLLRQSAQSGMFDIMAHVDLVKKFGHKPTEDLSGEIKKTAQAFKEAGVAIEINTSGIRKPVGEIYPALESLKIFSQIGVPIIFGSDAHDPADVGGDFDKAVILAKEAGYAEYVLFKKRKIEKAVKLQ